MSVVGIEFQSKIKNRRANKVDPDEMAQHFAQLSVLLCNAERIEKTFKHLSSDVAK